LAVRTSPAAFVGLVRDSGRPFLCDGSAPPAGAGTFWSAVWSTALVEWAKQPKPTRTGIRWAVSVRTSLGPLLRGSPLRSGKGGRRASPEGIFFLRGVRVSVPGQRAGQPGLGVLPVAVGGGPRDAQQVGGLAAEVGERFLVRVADLDTARQAVPGKRAGLGESLADKSVSALVRHRPGTDSDRARRASRGPQGPPPARRVSGPCG
jgi:hypothetical protein